MKKFFGFLLVVGLMFNQNLVFAGSNTQLTSTKYNPSLITNDIQSKANEVSDLTTKFNLLYKNQIMKLSSTTSLNGNTIQYKDKSWVAHDDSAVDVSGVTVIIGKNYEPKEGKYVLIERSGYKITKIVVKKKTIVDKFEKKKYDMFMKSMATVKSKSPSSMKFAFVNGKYFEITQTVPVSKNVINSLDLDSYETMKNSIKAFFTKSQGNGLLSYNILNEGILFGHLRGATDISSIKGPLVKNSKSSFTINKSSVAIFEGDLSVLDNHLDWISNGNVSQVLVINENGNDVMANYYALVPAVSSDLKTNPKYIVSDMGSKGFIVHNATPIVLK